MDRIFWNYLEGGPEQEAAWKEWQSGIALTLSIPIT